MLDEIADENGAGQADHTLSHVRKALGWWAIQDDDFSSPIIRGMARTKPSERARKRTLSDDEIRTLWAALDTMTEPSCYARFVKTLLLTGQRRDEVAQMQFQEIADDGVWTIPAERYKTKIPNHVPLSAAARALIGASAEGAGPYVFSTTNGKVPFSGYSVARKLLDERMVTQWQGPPQDRWVLHDLRRTAKTLMQRAKVRPDISERVLGHVIGGVEGTYDRYSYLDEKRDALEKLATIVERMLNPAPSKVASLQERRQGTGP
jgi:integrase